MAARSSYLARAAALEDEERAARVRARPPDLALADHVPHLRTPLDHIVYDGRLEPLSVEVLDAGRSDHFPVVGVFVLARAPA